MEFKINFVKFLKIIIIIIVLMGLSVIYVLLFGSYGRVMYNFKEVYIVNVLNK